jgi:hypothetical protein
MAEDKVEIITQWGIYNSTGYGLKFFERLEKGNPLIIVPKTVIMNPIVNIKHKCWSKTLEILFLSNFYPTLPFPTLPYPTLPYTSTLIIMFQILYQIVNLEKKSRKIK